MLDSRRLATLRAVLRSGSFAAAAAELGYTQSAISQHIAELERTVGLPLLQRRPVRPTPAGLIALAAADAAAEALSAAATELRALRDGFNGNIRLGAFASACSALAAPALARFAESRPHVRVTLVQLETDAAYAALLDGGLDIAITFDYNVAPQEPPSVLKREFLAKDPVVVALPKGHRLAARKSVALRALADEPWIAAPLAGLPLQALRVSVGALGFQASMSFEGDDFRTVLALVNVGRGVALLPRLALHQDLPRMVAMRPLRDDPLTRFLYISRLKTETMAPATAALEAAIRAEAGTDLREPR
jgi:DNA-binding transcriptional LysR family regulator